MENVTRMTVLTTVEDGEVVEWTVATYASFWKLTEKMRDAQRAYYRKRDRESLDRALALEKRVDQEISAIIAAQKEKERQSARQVYGTA